MEQWEYLTELVRADIEMEGVRAYFEEQWPEWLDPPPYTPETLMPRLNEWGDQGWELVHMQPVAGMGDNADVYFNGETYKYSNVYFCVFKRRKHVTNNVSVE